MKRNEITVTISGGQAFERDALASEIAALLNSLYVPVGLTKSLEVPEDEEHTDRIHHLSKNVVVYIKRAPP